MHGAKLTMPNGRRFAIVARSGSYSICWQSLPPELQQPSPGKRWHPISASIYKGQLSDDEQLEGLCCMVRDPVDRFRSACARQGVTPGNGLTRAVIDVHFWSLERMGLLAAGVTHFRFPDQLDACAQWLGLPVPVQQLNDSNDAEKPILTPEQEAEVCEIYAADIALWESLK
jgi:hypothetical protein